MRISIRAATDLDLDDLVEMALDLWPEEDEEDLQDALSTAIEAPDEIAFVAVVDGEPVGFATASIRSDYVEGSSGSPVGYLEGVWVDEDFRRRGLGRALVRAAEGWAGTEGCSEFGSDAYLEDLDSHAFHLSVGFEEAGRLVAFLKPLGEAGIDEG